MIKVNLFDLLLAARLCFYKVVFVSVKAPSQSPTNITAVKKNSTSLQVTWAVIPAKQVFGEIKGYIVTFFVVKNGKSSAQNITVESGNMNNTSLYNLQKFTNYSIRVLGFTERDKFGPFSHPVYVMTDEDGKKN